MRRRSFPPPRWAGTQPTPGGAGGGGHIGSKPSSRPAAESSPAGTPRFDPRGRVGVGARLSRQSQLPVPVGAVPRGTQPGSRLLPALGVGGGAWDTARKSAGSSSDGSKLPHQDGFRTEYVRLGVKTTALPFAHRLIVLKSPLNPSCSSPAPPTLSRGTVQDPNALLFHVEHWADRAPPRAQPHPTPFRPLPCDCAEAAPSLFHVEHCAIAAARTMATPRSTFPRLSSASLNASVHRLVSGVPAPRKWPARARFSTATPNPRSSRACAPKTG